MHQSAGRTSASRIADALTLGGAVLVLILHAYAGFLDMGHPVWRPVGHATVLVLVAWIVAVSLSALALVIKRGRSAAAAVTLAITLISAGLLLSV